MGKPQIQKIPFESPPGLYFERMGSADLVINEWNLVVYYDLELYWKEFENIKIGIQRLDSICNAMKEDDSCILTIADFRHIIKEIRSNNELLVFRSNNPHQRTRRGALNIVGNIANSLFGVLDSEYAEKMSTIIDNLKENDDYLLQLIKNQTSLIDATSNVIIKSQEITEQQLKEFHMFADRITAELKTLNQETKEHKLNQDFMLLVVRIILMINNYQRIQSSILNVMIDTHHGKVNPQLLSPEQLQTELLNIKEHLPSSLRLPARQGNLLELYSLLTIEGRAAPNQIIFRLKLPLCSYDHFEMLHIVPVPIPSNGSILMIKPSSNYLIVNLHRDQYYPLTDQELETCTITNDLSYMCKQHHPLYRRGSNISTCEFSFISHVSMPKSCLMAIVSNAPQWIQLLNPNHWIYFRANKSDINVVCGTTLEQTSLEGSGIIKLDSDCAIKEEQTTIQAHKLYPSSFKTSFIPTRNLSEFVIPTSSPNTLHSPVTHQSVLKDLQDIRERIDRLRDQESLPSRVQPHDVHQFAISYLGLLLVILLAALVIWKYIKPKCTNRQVKPTANPRTTTAKEFRLNINPEVELN